MPKDRGFTIIEIVVVMAIFGCLVAGVIIIKDKARDRTVNLRTMEVNEAEDNDGWQYISDIPADGVWRKPLPNGKGYIYIAKRNSGVSIFVLPEGK